MKIKRDVIVSLHPEVLRFDKDRYGFGQDMKLHKRKIMSEHPDIWDRSRSFNAVFSGFDKFNTESVKTLSRLKSWTYTKKQHEFALKQLGHIAQNYPLPASIKQIKKGKILDLSHFKKKSLFFKRLDFLVKEITKIPSSGPVRIDISAIGFVPLEIVHKKNSRNRFDPLLKDKIDTVWTLDVSGNPALSIKDIMAKGMVEDAIREGILDTSKIIVEGTSGNTGAGLALVAAKYGFKTVLIIPDKMSREKIDRLSMLGAHVVVTPTNVCPTDPCSYYTVRDYVTKMTNGWSTRQYDNLSNRQAHEMVTGPLIWEKTKGEVSVLIAPAGTGGTVTGIAAFLKKKNPNIKIIAVDTVGSILYLLKAGYDLSSVQKFAKGYTLQGFGEDIYPKNYDMKLIDRFIRISDKEGLYMTRYLPMLGFISGQSSGAAYAALWKGIMDKYIHRTDKAVVIFPDTGVPYRKDVFSDIWMRKHNFIN